MFHNYLRGNAKQTGAYKDLCALGGGKDRNTILKCYQQPDADEMRLAPPSLSPVAARELVHLLILQQLVGLRDGGGVTVNGAVNLRLFFGIVRYSEDMDLGVHRREAQARDVFDLDVLVRDRTTDELIAFLAEALPRQCLEEGYERALGISYRGYEGQVFEFLAEETRSYYGTQSTWDEIRLRTAALIENVLKRQDQE